jgi:hypothetical protein
MTLRILLLVALVGLAVIGGSQLASAAPQRRVVVVVDAAAAQDPAVLAEARTAVARAGGDAELRVPRTPTEQLSVTHYFAVKGYDLVVGVNLDHPVAVTPVAAKFPGTRFVGAQPGQVQQALAGK